MFYFLRKYIPQIYNEESPKQGSKRGNSQVRQNTLPIWVYHLSMIRKFANQNGKWRASQTEIFAGENANRFLKFSAASIKTAELLKSGYRLQIDRKLFSM